MWPLFLIGGVVIVGGWLWGASKVVSKSPPLTHDTFTASGKIQVGDIVEVSLNSVDVAASEKIIDVPTTQIPIANLNQADMAKLEALDKASQTGATAKFEVTSTGLLGTRPGNMSVSSMGDTLGKPVSIGVLVDPPLSARQPFFFLDASVRSVTRNGKQVG